MTTSPAHSQTHGLYVDSLPEDSEDTTSCYFENADTYVEETQTKLVDSIDASKVPPTDKVTSKFEDPNPRTSLKGFKTPSEGVSSETCPISQCPRTGPPGWRWRMDHRIFYAANGGAEVENSNNSGGDSLEKAWEQDEVNSPTSSVRRVLVDDDGLDYSKVNPKFLNALLSGCGDTPPTSPRLKSWECGHFRRRE